MNEYGLRVAGNPMGRSAIRGRSARPNRRLDAGRRRPSGLESAVELRQGKKSARQLENFVGPAQLFDFALQRLDAIPLFAGHAIAQAAFNLMLAHPFVQGMGHAANLRSDRFNRRPLGWVVLPMLLHLAYRTLPNFWRKCVRFPHDSILSRIGASSKSGAVHCCPKIGNHYTKPFFRKASEPQGGQTLLADASSARKSAISLSSSLPSPSIAAWKAAKGLLSRSVTTASRSKSFLSI